MSLEIKMDWWNKIFINKANKLLLIKRKYRQDKDIQILYLIIWNREFLPSLFNSRGQIFSKLIIMLKTSILKTTKFYKEEILNFFKGIINMI
jgi:hypothetical protein